MNPPTATTSASEPLSPSLSPGEAIIPPPPEERLSVLVERSFTQLLQSDAVQKIVHAQLEKTIGSIITDVISGYHSPFKKALETYVVQAMPMNFDTIGLAGYQGTILSIIKSKLDASLQKWIEKGMAEHLEELIAPPPESITIEELEEMLRKEQEEEDGEEIDITTDVRDRETGGYWQVTFKVRKQGFNEEFTLFATKEGELYNISLPYKGSLTKGLFVGRLYGFEKALFRLYIGKTKLLRD
jgi:hypothetical protein